MVLSLSGFLRPSVYADFHEDSRMTFRTGDELVAPSTPRKLEGALPASAGYGYIPGLDGLRALAVGIVILAHLGLEHIVPGGFGVTAFFFISGFLITRLLLAETKVKGRIDLKQFYLRRFVRLYPALLFMLFGSTALFWALGIGGPSLGEFISGVFYTSNLYQVGVDMGIAQPGMAWRPLWSLAVEEHFYLVFPLTLVLAGAFSKRLMVILLAVLAVVPLWRALVPIVLPGVPAEEYTYMMTDTRIDSIVWGCLLSVCLDRERWHGVLSRLVGWLPVIAALVVLAATFVIRDATFRMTIRYSLQGIALFVLMLNLYYLPSLRFGLRLLEVKTLTWLGTLSYALYLWHFPIADLTYRYVESVPLQVGIILGASVLLSCVSYYLVETPFLKLRKRLGSHGKPPAEAIL
jgi:peptidoglycan/LPS O-acetylase OafA/YrhL